MAKKPANPSFDTEAITPILKRAANSGQPMGFAYGHASSFDKVGLAVDPRKPGKTIAKPLKKTSKDITRLSFGTFTMVDGEMRFAPEKPIKGMIKHLVKRFRDEGLRRYSPVLVDKNGQVIDEDSLPDDDGEDLDPDDDQTGDTQDEAPAAKGPDPAAVKKKLLIAKKQVDALSGDKGDLPDLVTQALQQFKGGDIGAVVQTLGAVAKGLKSVSAEPEPTGDDKSQPGTREAAALKQISDLLPKAVKRLKELPDREDQAKLAPFAKEVQRLVKEGQAKEAAVNYKTLNEGLQKAEGNAANEAPNGAVPLEIWRSAKEQADKGISALQNALRAEDHPATKRIADLGLNGLSDETLQTRMMTALMDYSNDPRSPKKADALGSVVKDYRKFLVSPIVQHCDANPFGVKLDLGPILGKALDQIEKNLAG